MKPKGRPKGSKTLHSWLPEWVAFLHDNTPGRSCAELTKMFNDKFGTNFAQERIHAACSRYKFKNGIPCLGRNSRYTQEHIDFIRETYKGITCEEQAKLFTERFGIPCSKSIIVNLHRKAKVKSDMGKLTQFKKGQESHNKGKTWAEFMSAEGAANSRKTQFQKGHLPHNATEVGRERINKDGHIEVRVEGPVRVYPHKKVRVFYIAKHRLVWEQAHGPIPKGHVIRHIDNDPLNNTLENLECVSLAENAIINRHNKFDENVDLNKSRLAIAKLQVKTSAKRKIRKKKWTMSPEQKERCSIARRKWWAAQKSQLNGGDCK